MVPAWIASKRRKTRRSDHASGTDRAAEVALRLDRAFAVVVNVQGDEPFVTGTSLDRLVGAFDDERPPEMATLSEPLDDPEQP